jgi:protein gp37
MLTLTKACAQKAMGEKTKISWTDHTQNFWKGCKKISPGCENCYMFHDMRFHGMNPDQITLTKTWSNPLRWQRNCEKLNSLEMVFTNSWSDFFIGEADAWRPEAWEIIKRCPNLIWQILTKRPGLIEKRLPPDWALGYENVWLGVSVESKAYLWRMDTLRKIPAKVRFVSAEPLLEDLMPEFAQHLDGFHWVIVGGESGNHSNNYRPMDHEWARRIFAACKERNIAKFFKQSAGFTTETGTLLDGEVIHEYPAAPTVAPRPSRSDGNSQDFNQKGDAIMVQKVRTRPEGKCDKCGKWKQLVKTSPPTRCNPCIQQEYHEAENEVALSEMRLQPDWEETKRKNIMRAYLAIDQAIDKQAKLLQHDLEAGHEMRASWKSQISGYIKTIMLKPGEVPPPPKAEGGDGPPPVVTEKDVEKMEKALEQDLKAAEAAEQEPEPAAGGKAASEPDPAPQPKVSPEAALPFVQQSPPKRNTEIKDMPPEAAAAKPHVWVGDKILAILASRPTEWLTQRQVIEILGEGAIGQVLPFLYRDGRVVRLKQNGIFRYRITGEKAAPEPAKASAELTREQVEALSDEEKKVYRAAFNAALKLALEHREGSLARTGKIIDDYHAEADEFSLAEEDAKTAAENALAEFREEAKEESADADTDDAGSGSGKADSKAIQEAVASEPADADTKYDDSVSGAAKPMEKKGYFTKLAEKAGKRNSTEKPQRQLSPSARQSILGVLQKRPADWWSLKEIKEKFTGMTLEYLRCVMPLLYAEGRVVRIPEHEGKGYRYQIAPEPPEEAMIAAAART